MKDPGGPSSPVLPVTNQLPGQCPVVCFTHMAVRGEVMGTKAMYTGDHMGEQFERLNKYIRSHGKVRWARISSTL